MHVNSPDSTRPHAGFSFLEDELARKYKEAAPATLAILQQRCDEVGRAASSLAARLDSVQDVSALRKAGSTQSMVMDSSSQLSCISVHISQAHFDWAWPRLGALGDVQACSMCSRWQGKSRRC